VGPCLAARGPSRQPWQGVPNDRSERWSRGRAGDLGRSGRPLDGQDGSAAASERQPRGLCRWAPCQNQGRGDRKSKRDSFEFEPRDGASSRKAAAFFERICCCITWRRHWLSSLDRKRLAFGPSHAKEMLSALLLFGVSFVASQDCFVCISRATLFFSHNKSPLTNLSAAETINRRCCIGACCNCRKGRD
jgi:hypothetical protein